jgi:Tfp pilus assembly protein PilX
MKLSFKIKKNTLNLKNKPNNKGFVILFAVLLSSLFLVIGTSVFSISLKEIMLSGSGRDSQLAFHAADSGLECALYWDLNYQIFATSTHSGASPSNVFCADQDITASSYWVWKNAPTNDNQSETVFGFNIFSDEPSRQDCVIVSVKKAQVPGNPSNPFVTTIESRGYNTCNLDSTRRVERGLRMIY